MYIFVIQNAKGQPKQGVLLEKEDVQELGSLNLENIDLFPAKEFQDPMQGSYHLANSCFTKIHENPFSIFIGGDHYTSFGTILGSLKKYSDDLRVLWIDAHADIHSFETSPSGNMHGMPVRFLMTHNYSEFPRLKPHQIMYVGLRSVEQQEWDFIHENNIQYITSDRCLRFTDSSYEKIKEFIEDRPLHLSLDVDSLDPSIMFSTGTSVSDGLLLCHFSRIIEYAKKLASPFFAIDIMEYNPTIGNAEEKSISKQTMKEIIQIVSHI